MCESVVYGSGWLGWNEFDAPPLGAPAGPWIDLSYPAEPLSHRIFPKPASTFGSDAPVEASA